MRCQRCERPICPQCMQQASVGFHCPECVRGSGQRVITARTLRVGTPTVTAVLVAVNVVIFALETFARLGVDFGDGWLDPVTWQHRGELFAPAVAAGDWWRPITTGFLHVNAFHVALNMFLLWQLGRLLEPAMKRSAFLALYTLALLGGSFLQVLLAPHTRAVGASGAVFGLMGAAFVAMRSRGINPFDTGIGSLIVLNLVITFVIPGIAIGGHVGGLVAGALGGLLYWGWRWDPRGRSTSTVVPTVICVALAGGLYAATLMIA